MKHENKLNRSCYFGHEDIVSEAACLEELEAKLLSALLSEDAVALEILKTILIREEIADSSWLWSARKGHPFSRVLRSIYLCSNQKLQLQVWDILEASINLNKRVHPYDILSLLIEMYAEFTIALDKRDSVNSKLPLLMPTGSPSASGRRGRTEKLSYATDGIDHMFPFPKNTDQKISLLKGFTKAANQTNIYRLLCRAFVSNGSRNEHGASSETLRSPMLEGIIAGDISSALIKPEDYLVDWDLTCTAIKEYTYTVSEVSRILLMSHELQTPDVSLRPAVVDYYRSVLKTSGDAIIGLEAGVFHVEHGTYSPSSFFYLGPSAILGKGCKIDGIGGFVACKGSFLGGGYMPILIHTHKHINRGSVAADERLNFVTTAFVAERGSRLPMHSHGIIECYDLLERSPFPGIRGVHV